MIQVGDIVHYVEQDGPEATHGTCRAAIITRTYRNPHSPVDLTVFGDNHTMVSTRPHIEHRPRKEFGTWHLVNECGVG